MQRVVYEIGGGKGPGRPLVCAPPIRIFRPACWGDHGDWGRPLEATGQVRLSSSSGQHVLRPETKHDKSLKDCFTQSKIKFERNEIFFMFDHFCFYWFFVTAWCRFLLLNMLKDAQKETQCYSILLLNNFPFYQFTLTIVSFKFFAILVKRFDHLLWKYKI